MGRITGCLAALAIVGAGAGCAAPQATTSGAESLESASAVQPSTMPSTVPLSGSPSADPELSAVSPTVQAGQATAVGSLAIPAAPGTAGSNLKPVDSAPVITAGPGAVATPLPDCTPSTLRTNSPGKLTFTTGSLRAPWFSGASATDGDGYEAAVARAVASTLGYPRSAVEWTTDAPARVLAGAAVGYDVAVSQFVTPDATSATVDFSSGYFPIAQAVVARAGSPAAAVTDLAGLKSLKLGAVQRSQVVNALGTSGGRAGSVSAEPSDASGLAALRSGSIDAVVVDLPAAAAAGDGVVVLGQLPSGSAQPRQFGMVLHKASPLTSCVSAAIDLLRVDGTLAKLQQQWLPANSTRILQ